VDAAAGKDTHGNSVFAFDCCRGLLRSSLGHKPTQHIVNVKFCPLEARMYSHRIHIEVLGGQGFSILLEGQGVEEMPAEPTPPEPPKKKQQGRAKSHNKT
jgi:hypothetical protein